MLTDKQKAEYLKAPNTCPYCGAECLDVGSPDYYESNCVIKQRVECLSSPYPGCGKIWHDTYNLSGIEEEPESKE